MTSQQRAYLAGLLDSDGSIMLQLRPRKEMRFLFRPKALVIFYQNSSRHDELLKLQKIISAGYLYKRNDRMSEIRIEGLSQVKSLLKKLKPYIRFKIIQVYGMINAIKILQKRRKYSLEDFLSVCKLADEISKANYSTNRKYDYSFVVKTLRDHKIIPVTTGLPT